MTCSDTAAALLSATLLVAVSSASAQTALPATSPTTAVSPSQLPSANPSVARRALQVNWDGHLLQIFADGQTLADALQTVANRTGMRIVGTPPDDRIFGSYGPAPLVDLVSKLVDGLPVNILFVDHTGKTPAELTFTARSGAATPPSPSPQYQQVPPPQQAVFQPAQQAPSQSQQPSEIGAQGSPPTGATGAATDGSTANGNSTNPNSPNGVKTPQEIFEQLQRLRSGALKPQQ